ncbi:MAG: hypothetical protein L0H29_11395, partial [Sinobacteraceae bacterium]|nr:hypothetical protein [Nevskiaceae bacterium]
MLRDEVPRDDRPLHLRGALVDPRRPDIPVEVLERMPALQCAGAVQLHRLVDDPLGGLGGEELG